jgi:hypothetical protein
MIVELTDDEVKFLQACYQDSASEGCFDHLFAELNFERTFKSLQDKGVLKEAYQD